MDTSAAVHWPHGLSVNSRSGSAETEAGTGRLSLPAVEKLCCAEIPPVIHHHAARAATTASRTAAHRRPVLRRGAGWDSDT